MSDKKLISIITPVLEHMEPSHLKDQLIKHFPMQNAQMEVVENSFKELTSRKHPEEILYQFFKSWSQTNNSAMTVAGLSNRMTMLIHKNQPVHSEHDLFRSVASLNRIVDEDLAVVGRVLHSTLFYIMATSISGSDQWLLHDYLCEEAITFKKWKDQNSLRNDDIMIGLLTTLVHEIYTHGEVEFILPLFEKWLADTGMTKKEIARSLGWIKVHCGPTEKDHFFHAVDSIFSYSKAADIDLSKYDLGEIVSDYLNLKAAVMNSLLAQMVPSSKAMA